MKVFVVIPTIRDLNFLKAWKEEFRNCHIIIVEDHKKKEIKCPKIFSKTIYHYSWKDIQTDLSKNEWIFSRKNSGIRSYGYWKAYKKGADVIITLDDDCYPIEKNFVNKHIDNLNFKAPLRWFTTYPNPKWMYTRGFPYSVRNKIPIMVSHGVWSGALDLDGKIESKLPKLLDEKPYPPIRQVIPFGYYYPMCSMNLAFRREVTPIMFFPMMGSDPQGKRWGYDRYDDIWAGIFSKKIMDHLGWSVINGSPIVEHRKKSDSSLNLKKESTGMKINEKLWKAVEKLILSKKDPKLCYIELAKKINFPKEKYFQKLKRAMLKWGDLFN